MPSPLRLNSYEYPGDEEMRVSHETIYEALYLQARGELRTELKLALRTGRARRVPRSRSQAPKGQISGMVNISKRPPEATDRAVPGNLEGDLIIGKGGKSQIATLADRKSRFTILVKIPYDRTAGRVAGLLARKMETLPEFMRKSVTWDQGKEMARHADFTVRTGIPRVAGNVLLLGQVVIKVRLPPATRHLQRPDSWPFRT